MITIIPAIDMKGGKCVQLVQGLADRATVYGEDPVAMAHHWVEQGAEHLHLVDLDGAFQGKPVHTEFITKIASAIHIPVEIGGGLRTADDVQVLVEAGVDRVIFGTRACDNPDMLAELVSTFGNAIAVGIDARDGVVQVKGWVESADITAVDLARRMEDIGVRTIIFTDAAVDGMLTGVNVEATADMCRAVSCDIVASGGVKSAADIEALHDLRAPNLVGAIVGTALYEGQVVLEDMIKAGKPE